MSDSYDDLCAKVDDLLERIEELETIQRALAERIGVDVNVSRGYSGIIEVRVTERKPD